MREPLAECGRLGNLVTGITKNLSRGYVAMDRKARITYEHPTLATHGMSNQWPITINLLFMCRIIQKYHKLSLENINILIQLRKS